MILGVLFSILLICLAIWQIISRRQVSRRLTRSGLLVQARVTDIKHESRLVIQTGGATSTQQKLKYEDFLYAEWQDPLTQFVHKFRVKVADFYQFHVGEIIPIRMNTTNPNEYRIEYVQRTTQKSKPKLDTLDHDYQQGYQGSTTKTQTQIYTFNDDTKYEEPKASYPQQLLEQKNDE
jgi:hypothetical protein